MGAFYLLRHGRDRDLRRTTVAADQLLERSGFAAPRIIARPHFTLHVYPKIQAESPELVEYPDGDFAFVCGTMMFEGQLGRGAGEAFYRAFNGDTQLCDRAFGHFTIVLCKAGIVYVLSDRFGGSHVFRNKDNSVVTSSFLVACAFAPKLTALKQSVFEYVFNGVVSGNATMFAEIDLLPKGGLLTFAAETADLRIDRIDPPAEAAEKSLDSFMEEAIADLDGYFAAVAQLFENRVNTALSGGYDSRLILAMLRRHNITPRLYVYGQRSNQDVRIATEIARGEGLELDWIDKDTTRIERAAFPEIVAHNYLATDGYGWGGIFNNGAELAERVRRTANGYIALNGGGGEIFRNFFYLTDGSYTPRALLWSFYSQFDSRQCTDLFDPETYYRGLEEKLFELLASRPKVLPRATVEWLYHGFRCRSWDGKVNTINNRFGHTGLPFLEQRITAHASRIPIHLKSHGAFEAALICRIDRRLASYPTDYGHDFTGAPPMRRIVSDFFTYLRPPALRRLTYRVKNWPRRAAPREGYLSRDYVATVLPKGAPILSRLFKLDTIQDEQFARIVSLEYALGEVGDRLSTDF